MLSMLGLQHLTQARTRVVKRGLHSPFRAPHHERGFCYRKIRKVETVDREPLSARQSRDRVLDVESVVDCADLGTRVGKGPRADAGGTPDGTDPP